MNKFETIYKECKYYTDFNKYQNDYVGDYNIFMKELEIQAKKLESFNEEKFEFFTKSWRFNAQQNMLDINSISKKQFLKQVYNSYN
jgi:hypothetical protein